MTATTEPLLTISNPVPVRCTASISSTQWSAKSLRVSRRVLTRGIIRRAVRRVKNGTGGDELGTKAVTVFWFDAKVTAKAPQGNRAITLFNANNGLFGINPSGGAGMQIWGRATIIPAGVNHEVPQVADWSLGVVQNVSSIRTWRGQYVYQGTTKKVKGVVQMATTLDCYTPSPDFLLHNDYEDESGFTPEGPAKF